MANQASLALIFVAAMIWPTSCVPSAADEIDGSLCSIGAPREQKLPAHQHLSLSFGAKRPPIFPHQTQAWPCLPFTRKMSVTLCLLAYTWTGVSGMPPGSHMVYAEVLRDGRPHFETEWFVNETAPRDVLVLDVPPLPPGYFTVGILLLKERNGSDQRDLLAIRKMTIEVRDSDLPISDEVALIDLKSSPETQVFCY